MSEAVTEPRLSLDWELWLVEQLLFAGKRDDLVAVLVERGVSRADAAAQIAAIEGSASFERLRRRAGEASLAARLQRLAWEIDPMVAVPVATDLAPEVLLREHWAKSRPIKLTEAARGIGAVQRWTIAGLAERFPDATVSVNVERTRAPKASQVERFERRMALGDLAARALGAPGNELYAVSRSGLLSEPQLAALWEDLAPLPPYLDAPERPRGVSLWLGPAGTLTPPHFDPHNVLLVQVEGSKRVRLARRLSAPLFAKLEGYYLAEPLEEVFAPSEIFTVQLDPGEALFIPVGWFHEVTALTPSITLSFLSFLWENHFHWLGPPGSDDSRL